MLRVSRPRRDDAIAASDVTAEGAGDGRVARLRSSLHAPCCIDHCVAAAVKRRECGKLVALNFDLLHGERSPPVEASGPLGCYQARGKGGVPYRQSAWLD